MADSPSEKEKTTEPPAPEVLKPQSDTASSAPSAEGGDSSAQKVTHRARHATYRPSHKATFIGLGVVVAILVINVAVIVLVMRSQSTNPDSNVNKDTVTLSAATLDKLGVSRNAVGNLGTELIVGPNSKFNGTVTIGGDTSIGGQLKLNSKFTTSDASITTLQAGKTSLQQLDVNGDGTFSNLTLRKDLNIAGVTRMQGPVTLSQLLTVNNNVNVAGNLAIGGTLSTRGFQASSLVSDTTLVVGGHIITRGSAPSVSQGNALGSNGTVSISGSDAAGTVAANTGVGATAGVVATVTFHQPYSSTPHVIVEGGGQGVSSWWVSRSATGFTIGVNGGMAPGGYFFDYVVVQ